FSIFCSTDTATDKIYTLSLHDALPILTKINLETGVGVVSLSGTRMERRHGAFMILKQMNSSPVGMLYSQKQSFPVLELKTMLHHPLVTMTLQWTTGFYQLLHQWGALLKPINPRHQSLFPNNQSQIQLILLHVLLLNNQTPTRLLLLPSLLLPHLSYQLQPQ